MKFVLYKSVIFFFIYQAIFTTALGQGLPSVQQISLRAPINIAIDGKTIEWDNRFQAQNNATELFYTMSNDDNNLYFCGQAKSEEIINKIFSGGVTLTIQKTGKKDDKQKISITYPVTTGKYPLIFNLKGIKGEILDTSKQSEDSIMAVNNNLLQQKCKWILIKGVVGMDDTLSVYNEDGFKAVGLFDNKKNYTFELSIPLARLGLSINDVSKFTYQVVVNGRIRKRITPIAPPGSSPEQLEAIARASESFNQAMGRVNAPTDFSGEYTLAKKP